jgi:hypothetical protein
MEHGGNLHLVALNYVGCNIGCAGNDQLPRFRYTPSPPGKRKIAETFDRSLDFL